MSYTFVALDLETTWLSPEIDTIIEVAAIRFSLTRDASGWQVCNIDERSMLVNPERPMTDEISMITGISDAMLGDKPVWWDIRERVREFIGTESIIVGHNVLFDVAMLGTHDIDLSGHTIFDTFELSELLSQDAESLNLGYLSWLYGISAWDKEHRALWDTRLSVWLFIHYINQIEKLPERKKSILIACSKLEKEKNLSSLVDLIGIQSEASYFLEKISHENHKYEKYDIEKISTKKIDIVSIHQVEDEEKLIREHMKKWEVQILVPSVRVGEELTDRLVQEYGIPTIFQRSYHEYCSIESLESILSQWELSRKDTILITKLLFWLETTETWLLEELKFYGSERARIHFFRAREWEIHTGMRQQDIWTRPWVTIHTLYNSIKYREENTCATLLIKDLPLMEDIVARARSISIDIELLVQYLEERWGTSMALSYLRMIEGIYLSFPVRPTGKDIIPPGDFGETYLLKQQDVWSYGFETLALATDMLDASWREWQETRIQENREDIIQDTYIDESIGMIVGFHRILGGYHMIMNIRENALFLNLIPKDIPTEIEQFLSKIHTTHIIGYGYNLRHPLSARFIENCLGMRQMDEKPNTIKQNHHLVYQAEDISSITGGTVILTTNTKHVREIGRTLKSLWKNVLIQWISGGKGKMIWLFLQDPENTILVGTVENWRDEFALWEKIHHLIIAKLPFDPPTDAYFLARTIGMRNNFEVYSMPLVISKINTLIGRVQTKNPTCTITCWDERIISTEWGKNILNEIL